MTEKILRMQLRLTLRTLKALWAPIRYKWIGIRTCSGSSLTRRMSWNQSMQDNSSIPAPSQNRKGGHTTAIDTQDSSASSPALPIDRMTDSDREPAFGRRGGWNCDSAKSPFARDNSIHRIQKRNESAKSPNHPNSLHFSSSTKQWW